MTGDVTSRQIVPKSPACPEGLFLMDGIEGLRSLPKDSAPNRSALWHYPELLGCAAPAPGAVGGGQVGCQAGGRSAVFRTMPL